MRVKPVRSRRVSMEQINAGFEHLQAGRLQEAEGVCRQLLQADPNDANAWRLYGFVAQAGGNVPFALEAFTRAVELAPEVPEFRFTLGNALRIAGRIEPALEAYRRALALRPDYSDALVNFGIALDAAGQRDEAERMWQSALGLNPADVEALTNLSNQARSRGRLAQAVDYAERALKVDPNCAAALNNLAFACQQQGRVEESIRAFRRTVELAPSWNHAHSNLLLALNYSATVSSEEVLAEHRRWDERHARPLRRDVRHDNDRSPDRRLRVGYISPDFREHPVAFFVEPILSAHDRAQVEVFCYSGVSRPDAVTRRIEGYGHTWRPIAGLSDGDVADQVHRDRIDLLIDLTGHTAEHRLGVMARQPAPVQASYLGYPNTTGMAAVQWRISDALADPPGMTESHWVERLYRLPRCAWCFRPPADLPAPAARPAGAITFGSFNKHPKISSSAIDAWASVLSLVEESKLLLKSGSLGDDSTRQRTLALFAARGIGADRLVLCGPTQSLQEHLATYDRVDIALDTFPYNGTTTTCDAMLRGVPVVTLAGSTHASRVGVSLLTAAGMPELIAADANDYVRRAVEWARDRDRLSRVRSELPGRLLASPLTDAAGMARAMEAAYRSMWHAWCAISA